MAGLARDGLDHRDGFLLGLVRQHGAGGDVADGPDSGGRGAAMVGLDEAAFVGRHPDTLQAQALGIGTAADGEQHVVGGDGLRRPARHGLEGQVDAVG